MVLYIAKCSKRLVLLKLLFFRYYTYYQLFHPTVMLIFQVYQYFIDSESLIGLQLKMVEARKSTFKAGSI